MCSWKVTDDPRLVTDIAGRKIPKVLRRNCIIDSDTKRLGIGRRGKLGGPGDGRAGIVDFEGMAGETIIEEAKRLFREEYKRRKKVEFAEGKTTYPSKTWFAFVEKRRPLLLIYLMDIDVDKDETNQKIQVDRRNSCSRACVGTSTKQ